jgi:vacuolar-type H+-ATPase subunit C/Vma6
MTAHWEDLNARARGLATHLLSGPQQNALTLAPDIAALGEALRRFGYPLEAGAATPGALELALRRMAAGRLRILARWCGPRVGVVTVWFEDEDRRSLRAMVRGAVQHAPADARLAGLVPTPALPERALRELANQPTPAAVAALLTAWRNPYGSALLAAAAVAQPDLFSLEILINRTFAQRASHAARRGGLLAEYVRETVDIENAGTALILAAEGKDVIPREVFLPGGGRLSLAAFEAAVATGSASEAGRRIAAAFVNTPLGAVFVRAGDDPAPVEGAVLRVRIRELVRAARVHPLGPAPLLAYALRLRAEILDVQRILWGVALRVPRDTLAQDLVTV